MHPLDVLVAINFNIVIFKGRYITILFYKYAKTYTNYL